MIFIKVKATATTNAWIEFDTASRPVYSKAINFVESEKNMILTIK